MMMKYKFCIATNKSVLWNITTKNGVWYDVILYFSIFPGICFEVVKED